MPLELTDIDINDNRNFYRQDFCLKPENVPPNVPPNVPVLGTFADSGNYESTGSAQIPEKIPEKEVVVPKCLNLRCLSEKESLMLAKKFSEYQLIEAVNDAKWYSKQGKNIKSYFGLIWSRACNY
jgi:hypothetical protein